MTGDRRELPVDEERDHEQGGDRVERHLLADEAPGRVVLGHTARAITRQSS